MPCCYSQTLQCPCETPRPRGFHRCPNIRKVVSLSLSLPCHHQKFRLCIEVQYVDRRNSCFNSRCSVRSRFGWNTQGAGPFLPMLPTGRAGDEGFRAKVFFPLTETEQEGLGLQFSARKPKACEKSPDPDALRPYSSSIFSFWSKPPEAMPFAKSWSEPYLILLPSDCFPKPSPSPNCTEDRKCQQGHRTRAYPEPSEVTKELCRCPPVLHPAKDDRITECSRGSCRLAKRS